MNSYIAKLYDELNRRKSACITLESDSILELLWDAYSAANPVKDAPIRQAEDALAPIFDSLSYEHSEILFSLVSELCVVHQHAAFLDGIRLGFCLNTELAEQ